jgi:hypothetical protein
MKAMTQFLALSVLLVAFPAAQASECSAEALSEDGAHENLDGMARLVFTIAVTNCNRCFGEFEYTLVYEDADGESVTVELASGWDAQDSSKLFETDDDEFIGADSTIVSVSNGTVTKCVCLDGSD